jgi:hypothetical protein
MTSKRQLTEDPKTKETQPKPTETSKKRKKHHSSDETSGKNEKLISKEERRLQKAQRKDEKTQLLEQIPKVDSNGIAYTKIQIRRMMRRVKNGLQPVPTEEEERQMKRERKREKQMEEDELAGILYDRKTLEDPMDDDDDDNNDDNDDGNDEQQEDEGDGEEEVDLLEKDEDVDDEEPKAQVDSATRQDGNPKKKPKSLKPVPSDYICQACQNKHTPIHWIYDCPDKIYRPGCNKLTKKERGIHIPSERKVFVSGLPFDWKNKDVVDLFLKECGAVVEHCKLLMFEDTKRCKGQAFVTFDNEESAKKGLKLHGKALESLNKKTAQDGNSRKELTLGVTKVQNRRKQA